MRLKAIVCDVFKPEFETIAEQVEHDIDFVYFPIGLHNKPDELRTELQRAVSDTTSSEYDYILLGYGLCSRGTANITAGKTPLVLFRAHDCIAVLLGSRQKYVEEFTREPGTYYYSPGWIHEKRRNQDKIELEQSIAREMQFRRYAEKYGEDNARYLIEMENRWINNYSRAAFINTGIGDIEDYRAFVREIARKNGWRFEEIESDWKLMREFLSGNWNEDDFLVVEPGQTIMEIFTEEIITAR